MIKLSMTDAPEGVKFKIGRTSYALKTGGEADAFLAGVKAAHIELHARVIELLSVSDGRDIPNPQTWRGLDDKRLQVAIDAFYEPCEGTTIDGVRAAIVAWEASGPDMSKVISALKYYAQQKGDGAAAEDALLALEGRLTLSPAPSTNEAPR